MDNDKRKGDQVVTDGLREELNRQQRLTLGELEMLGWSLRFVRRPLFQEPVPVVVCKNNTEVGLLDSDGKIIIDRASKIREECDESESADESYWVEKRRGEAPIPENLGRYLNKKQLCAIQQFRIFGWQLEFIRRPMFQEPVAIIINGDSKLGILETDGRITLRSNIDFREEPVEEETGEETVDEEDNKQAG